MSDENENDTTTQYAYRHMPIALSRKRKKYPWQLKIYVPHSFEHTAQKLIEILDREGSSMSEWFREQAEAYVSIHWPGNPQLPLTKFTGEPVKADPFGCGFFMAERGNLVRCRLSLRLHERGYCMHICKYGPRRR